jgi:hypothetical protein
MGRKEGWDWGFELRALSLLGMYSINSAMPLDLFALVIFGNKISLFAQPAQTMLLFMFSPSLK